MRSWTWPWLLATQAAKAVLAVVICLGAWGALPAAIGWLPTTVSSGSMLPRMRVGDVAVSRPVGVTPPTVDSVLLFDDPDHPGRLRMHRFVRVADDGRLVTRGDANADDDSSPVALSAVHGIGTLLVPWVGLPVVWLRERAWVPLGAAVLVLLALTAVAGQSRRFGFPQPDQPDDPDQPGSGDPGPHVPASGVPAPGELGQPQAARPVADGSGREAGERAVRREDAPRPGPARTALGVAVLLALLPATPAGAAFSDTTATRATAAAATYFSCDNAVAARSPYIWYRMDETSTTSTAATDSSAGGRTGLYSSAGRTVGATRACTTDAGRAMTFNGSTGYLSSPLITTALPQTFTIAVWFRTTTTRGGKLIGFGNSRTGASSAYDRHLYMTDGGRVVFGVYDGAIQTLTTPVPANNGAWHQALATVSPAGMRLYLDGDLVAADLSVTSAESTGSGYLRVAYDNLDGWTTPPTSRYFAGTLDEAVVYTTALTAAQVDAQYDARS